MYRILSVGFLAADIAVARTMGIWDNGGTRYFRSKQVCSGKCWSSPCCTGQWFWSTFVLYQFFREKPSWMVWFMSWSEYFPWAMVWSILLWKIYDGKIPTFLDEGDQDRLQDVPLFTLTSLLDQEYTFRYGYTLMWPDFMKCRWMRAKWMWATVLKSLTTLLLPLGQEPGFVAGREAHVIFSLFAMRQVWCPCSGGRRLLAYAEWLSLWRKCMSPMTVSRTDWPWIIYMYRFRRGCLARRLPQL